MSKQKNHHSYERFWENFFKVQGTKSRLQLHFFIYHKYQCVPGRVMNIVWNKNKELHYVGAWYILYFWDRSLSCCSYWRTKTIFYDGWKEWSKSNKPSRHSSHSFFNCLEIFNFIKLTSAYKVYFHVPLLNQSHKALTFLSFHHVAVFSILTQLFRLLERFFASSIIYYLWNMEIQIDFKFSKITK